MNSDLLQQTALTATEALDDGVPCAPQAKPSKSQQKKLAAEAHNEQYETLKAQDDLARGLGAIEAETNKLAAGLLQGEQAWDIVDGMRGVTTQLMLNTQNLILPVLENLDTVILPKLEDPTGFQKNLQTAMADLADMTEAVRLLTDKHAGKTGAASEDDLVQINAISLGYSQIQSTMEAGVTPMLNGLIDTMQKAGIEELPTGAGAAAQSETSV